MVPNDNMSNTCHLVSIIFKVFYASLTPTLCSSKNILDVYMKN